MDICFCTFLLLHNLVDIVLSVHLFADIADQCLDIVHHLVKVFLLGE